MSTGYARSVEEARLLAHAILNLGQLHMEQGKLDDAELQLKHVVATRRRDKLGEAPMLVSAQGRQLPRCASRSQGRVIYDELLTPIQFSSSSE